MKSTLPDFRSSRDSLSMTTLTGTEPLVAKTVSFSSSFAPVSSALSGSTPGGKGEGIVFGSFEEVFNAGGASSGMVVTFSGEGRVVKKVLYSKPWQPPDSTDNRRARLGLEYSVVSSWSFLPNQLTLYKKGREKLYLNSSRQNCNVHLFAIFIRLLRIEDNGCLQLFFGLREWMSCELAPRGGLLDSISTS